MKAFKLQKSFGPPRQRAIFNQIVEEINKRTPLEDFGIWITEEPGGMRISTKSPNAKNKTDTTQGASGGTGTPVDIYGALNGAVTIYHLLQSSPPTSPPP